MSKQKEAYVFQEAPGTSTKLNQLIVDSITPARLVFDFTMVWNTNIGPAQAEFWYFGWWPYNPEKSIYDRLRIHYRHTQIGGSLGDFEYSLDSAASWVPFSDAGSSGLPLSTLLIGGANVLAVDIRLDEITSFQHIGTRLDTGRPSVPDHLAVNLIGYLWSTEDTPF